MPRFNCAGVCYGVPFPPPPPPEAGYLSPFDDAWYYHAAWTWGPGGWSVAHSRGPEKMKKMDAMTMFYDEGYTQQSQPGAYAGLWVWEDGRWQLEKERQNF